MKIRNGFVSNSSSSSFCIIGIDNEGLALDLAEAEGFPVEDDDHYGRHVSWDAEGVIAGYGCWELDKGTILRYYGGEELCYAGFDAESILEDQSIQSAREEFCDRVKEELGIEIHPKHVGLHYGEVHSG